MTVDRLLPASRIIIAKLTSRELAFEVPPTSAQDDVIRGSKIAEAVLGDLTREHRWEELREDTLWNAWKGGTAAIALDWDSKAGTPLGLIAESNEHFGTGDTRETALSLAEFVVEPGVKDAETARWWIRAAALPPEQVQDMFGLNKKPAADATAGLTPLEHNLLSTNTGFSAGRAGNVQPNLTMVYTMYERPHGKSEGRIISVVGNRVVDKAKWPFPFKERLNIVVMHETRLQNRWTGISVLSTARPMQVAYNQSWSSIVEHMKLAGNARLKIPESAVRILESLSDLPGELLPVPDQSLGGVDWLSPPQMPGWWIQQPDRLAAEIDDALSVHDVLRGDAPPNIESGLGLSILAEQDATPLGRMTKELAGMFSRLGSLVLEVYQDKVKETREARITNPGFPPVTARWTGKALRGQTGAIVPVDVILPRSRAAMQEFATRMMEMFPDAGLGPADFAKLADLHNQRDFLDAVSPDVSKARRENHLMALEEVPQPRKWDDHEQHIREHNRFRKSVEYEALSDDTREIVDLHVQAHATLAAEESGQAVARGAINPALAATPTANEGPILAPEQLEGALGSEALLQGNTGGQTLDQAITEVSEATAGVPEGLVAETGVPGGPELL